MSPRTPAPITWANRLLGHAILPQQRIRASQFAALPLPTADVVFLGGSITEYGLWNEWFRELSVANRGIAGDTTRGVLRRMGTAVGTQRVVSLLIGTNDLAVGTRPEALSANVTRITAAVRRADPDSAILLNSVMPRARAYRERVREPNRLLAAGSAQGRRQRKTPISGSDRGSSAVPVGFEPTDGLHHHMFSRHAPSAARTRYRGLLYGSPRGYANRRTRPQRTAERAGRPAPARAPDDVGGAA